MGKIKPIAHEDELSLVEHLDELRTRIIVLLVAFAVVGGVCFWQNHFVLEIVNAPLPDGKIPSTFGVSEAFTSTLTVSAYAALLILSPLVIYEIYAFVIPAFTQEERNVAKPFLLLAPFLFIAGSVFGYLMILPAALSFLLDFNADDFNIQLRAGEYYSFFGLTVFSMGLLFELPLAILIATRVGIVTPLQLRKNRRYAVVAAAVIAVILPGTDPVSMVLQMAPLLVLFELSIWLATFFGSPRAAPAEDSDSVVSPDSPDATAAMR